MENIKLLTTGYIIEKVISQTSIVREEDEISSFVTSDFLSEYHSDSYSDEDRVVHVCSTIDPAVDMGRKVLTIGGSERQFIWGKNLKKYGIELPNKKWGVFLDKKSPDKFFLAEDTNDNFEKAFIILSSEEDAIKKIADLRADHKAFLAEINSIADSDWKDEMYQQIWFKIFKFEYK